MPAGVCRHGIRVVTPTDMPWDKERDGAPKIPRDIRKALTSAQLCDHNLHGAAQEKRSLALLEHAKRIHATDPSLCWLSDYSLNLRQCPVCLELRDSA